MGETVLERDELSGTSEWDCRLDLSDWDAPLSKRAKKVVLVGALAQDELPHQVEDFGVCGPAEERPLGADP
jgi:hypothetical protein